MINVNEEIINVAVGSGSCREILHMGSDSEQFYEQFDSENIHIDYSRQHRSMQDFLDMVSTNYDWTIISDLFDQPEYEEEKQYQFIFDIVNRCMEISNTGVIFVIRERWTVEFKYSILYIIARLFDVYPNNLVTIKNCNGRYIFCINKER